MAGVEGQAETARAKITVLLFCYITMLIPDLGSIVHHLCLPFSASRFLRSSCGQVLSKGFLPALPATNQCCLLSSLPRPKLRFKKGTSQTKISNCNPNLRVVCGFSYTPHPSRDPSLRFSSNRAPRLPRVRFSIEDMFSGGPMELGLAEIHQAVARFFFWRFEREVGWDRRETTYSERF